jgi:hypothetical protein
MISLTPATIATRFNIYLMHDAMEETLDACGEEIIPALEAKSVVKRVQRDSSAIALRTARALHQR